MRALLKDIEIQNKAIGLLASNPIQKDVAEEMGVSEPTISKFKKQNAALIEKEASKYLTALPSIVENDIKEIKASHELNSKLIELLKEDGTFITDSNGKEVFIFPTEKIQAIQKFKDSVDKKVTDIKRSIGILNSHTPALIFQQMNIFQDNSTNIDPVIMQFLGSIGNDLDDSEDNKGVIEADIVDK